MPTVSLAYSQLLVYYYYTMITDISKLQQMINSQYVDALFSNVA